MKSDPAIDPPHQLAPKTETRFEARREPEGSGFSPRYVEVPALRHALRIGQRNLLWGAALLCGALVLIGLGVLIAGPRVVLWPLAALLTFAALWVLARMRIFQQRNGVFFSLALIGLLAAMLALAECGFEVLAGSRAMPSVSLVGSRMQTGNGDALSPGVLPAPEPVPVLSEAMKITPPDPADGSRVKVLRNSEAKIGGKTYRVLAGETFPLEEAKGGEVTFGAGEFRAKIATENVQILGPQRGQPESNRKSASNDTREARPPSASLDPAHVEIERRARAEALRRFPALAKKNSPENQEFVRTYSEMKQERAAMLEDPEWPIRLAEFLAKELGWTQVDDSEPSAPKAPARGVIEE